MSDKTKAEQVAELVGDDALVNTDVGNDLLVLTFADIGWDVAFVDVEDNPNTAEQIANALRVLAGEVVELPSIPDAIQQILDRVELQQKESGSTELDNTAHHLWYAHKGSLPRMEFPKETFDELVERVEEA